MPTTAGWQCPLPHRKCSYHICGASTGAVKYNAFKSQSGRNASAPQERAAAHACPELSPLALGYLLKCYKFHKQAL